MAAVGLRIQGFGDQPPCDLGTIGIRGVNQVEAELHGAAEHAAAFVRVTGLAEASSPTRRMVP